MLPAQPNKSLMNGFDCLLAVASSPDPLGSRQIARRLQLEHTRVNRLLGTLCHLGLVEQTANRKYRPGPGLHALSAQSLRASGLLRAALPHLEPLSAYGMTVSLGVLWRWQVCYLVYANPGEKPAETIGAHPTYVAHESIHGLALLAVQENKEIISAAKRLAPPLTANALETLLAEIEATRKRGFAFRSRRQQWISISTTVGSPAIAAIALTGTPSEATETEAIAAHLHVQARLIEKEMGL